MKIGEVIEIVDESLREYKQSGTIIGLHSGVEHLLVAVSLKNGGQRLFKACALSSGGCPCGSAIHAYEARTGLTLG